MTQIDYPYIREDALKNKVTYSYSIYKGRDFMRKWKESRSQFINNSNSEIIGIDVFECFDNLNQTRATVFGTNLLLNNWIFSLREGKPPYESINLLLKRFEVTKRIYCEYDNDFRPIDKTDYNVITNYLKFGCVLVLCYQITSKLQYLNTLLKVNDIMCGLTHKMSLHEQVLFKWNLVHEIKFIESLDFKFH